MRATDRMEYDGMEDEPDMGVRQPQCNLRMKQASQWLSREPISRKEALTRQSKTKICDCDYA